jgi:hypothetical protein
MPSGTIKEELQRNKKPTKGNEGGGGKMQRSSYPSDLSEREWKILEALIPPAKPGGHPRTTDTRSAQCHFVHRSHRLPMACLAARVPTVVDGVELLPQVAQRRHVEADAYGLARTGARESRAPVDPECRHHRQSIGQDHAKGGRAGTTAARRSKDASTTCWSIPLG